MEDEHCRPTEVELPPGWLRGVRDGWKGENIFAAYTSHPARGLRGGLQASMGSGRKGATHRVAQRQCKVKRTGAKIREVPCNCIAWTYDHCIAAGGASLPRSVATITDRSPCAPSTQEGTSCSPARLRNDAPGGAWLWPSVWPTIHSMARRHQRATLHHQARHPARLGQYRVRVAHRRCDALEFPFRRRPCPRQQRRDTRLSALAAAVTSAHSPKELRRNAATLTSARH